MPADADIDGDGGPSKGPAVPSDAFLHELAEALTAIGNYLASAKTIYDSALLGPSLLGESLEKGLGQHERAVEATRRLRELNRPRRKVERDCLIGFR
jgi:hypothetical protein